MRNSKGSGPRGDRSGVIGAACAIVFMIVLTAVTGRIILLETDPPPRLTEYVDDRTSARKIEPIRGDLLDRRGRVVSTSRFEYRLVVDPVVFPDPPDEAIVKLAQASGLDAGKLGRRIIDAMAENDVRARAWDQWLGPADDEAPTSPRLALIERLWNRLGLIGTADPTSQTQLTDWARDAGGPDPIIRYLPFSDLLDLEAANRTRTLHIPGVSFDRVAVRDYPGQDVAASLIGKVGYGHVGLLGAELSLNERLTGDPGRIRYVRDHRGRPLWVGRGDWKSPARGEDVRLSTDLELQRIANEELIRGVYDANAAGGRLMMLDPATGEVLAMIDYIRDDLEAEEFPWVKLGSGESAEVPRDHNQWPRYRVIRSDPKRDVHPALGRNRCVEDIYEPGSTFKPFVWAYAKEEGLLPDDEVIHIADAHNYRTPYGRHLADVGRHSELTWPEVLLYSSNIGMSKVADRLPHRDLQNLVHWLGFGQKTELGLPGEASGLVTAPKDWTEYTQTSVAIGYEIGVTPVQMVRAFSAFARDGELAGTIPAVRLTAIEPDDPLAGLIERVYKPETALRVRSVIEGVVERMDQLRLVRFPDDVPCTYRMFGKSGTAKIAVSPPPGYGLPKNGRGYFEKQYNSSFIAGAPFEHPRLVILVVIDDPGPELVRIGRAYGSSVAGPVVRRVMERSLRYLGVPPDMPASDQVATR